MPNARYTSDAAVPHRFRPRALPTVAALAAVVAFVAAGHWQGRRMHEKEALRAQLDIAAAQAAIPLATLPADADWNSLRYRTVIAAGTFDAGRQILVDNRVHEGRAGYHVVTPLALVDGRTVLVNRGWTPQGTSRATLPQIVSPPGNVSIVGRIATPSAGFIELSREPPAGTLWQNVDPARFTAATGVAVLPFVIEATRAPAPDDGLVRDWPAPDFGIEKHQIYMLQWYALAVLVVVFWVFVHRRRSAPRPDA